jgi:hypothetical protein
MAQIFTKEPLNNRRLVASKIACCIKEFIDEESRLSDRQKEELRAKLINGPIQLVYDAYLDVSEAYCPDWFKKSVRLSYGGGIFGLSGEAKNQLLYDIRRELNEIL